MAASEGGREGGREEETEKTYAWPKTKTWLPASTNAERSGGGRTIVACRAPHPTARVCWATPLSSRCCATAPGAHSSPQASPATRNPGEKNLRPGWNHGSSGDDGSVSAASLPSTTLFLADCSRLSSATAGWIADCTHNANKCGAFSKHAMAPSSDGRPPQRPMNCDTTVPERRPRLSGEPCASAKLLGQDNFTPRAPGGHDMAFIYRHRRSISWWIGGGPNDDDVGIFVELAVFQPFSHQRRSRSLCGLRLFVSFRSKCNDDVRPHRGSR